jgi:GDPmannose 4,6-dehydratase
LTPLAGASHSRRALITGITGQDGSYLAELLVVKGYEVFGLVREPRAPAAASVSRLIPGLNLVAGDLTDMHSISAALEVARPTEIYNLGAMSFVAESWEKAHFVTEVTATGALNMLEATRLFAGSEPGAVKFYQASSSEMFGSAATSPQDETTAFWPRSPYGVAKVYAHHMTVNYRESYGMHASSGILFNHESPRRGAKFVTRKISQAVARISLGLQDELILGNLDTSRDWGFAGDYVEAMWRMLQQDEASDYIIATGQVHSLRDFVDVAFATVGISDWGKIVRQDPSFMRPADIQTLVGNPQKAEKRLGWKPRVNFEELVTMMVLSDIEANCDPKAEEPFPS